MPALFTNTSNRQISSRSDAAALTVAGATPHPKPVEADGGRLLSPHEIAALLVLASEPRHQQADPADLRCVVDRGLVRLDAAPLADAPVDLSSDGRQMVLRLGGRDRAGHGRNVEFTAVRRMFMDATAIGALR